MKTSQLALYTAAAALVATLLLCAEPIVAQEPAGAETQNAQDSGSTEDDRGNQGGRRRGNQRYWWLGDTEQPGSSGRDPGGRGSGGRRGGGSHPQGAEPVFYTEVPPHDLDVILARPADQSVTVSVLAYHDREGYVEYGTASSEYALGTKVTRWTAMTPSEVVLDGLDRNKRYYYRVRYREPDDAEFQATEHFTFHTQRPPGSTFTFTVQADSHLDGPTSPELYTQTIANARRAKPDFHVDLGDTFMTDKYGRDYTAARQQYLAQRYYLGLVCHSAPLLFVIGNHDGEAGRWLDGTTDNMGVWSHSMRTTHFPTPVPDGFYTGNATALPHLGLPQNYYAWHWGDALFVVLDPYWHTVLRSRQDGDHWYRTLGREQYDWLRNTLETSSARFKFVFIHHLVGGTDSSGRGGAEAASYFEWGGHSLDGRYEFDARRPGWEEPIHQLLVDNNVSVVFHGHDHFYARQDLDGVVYQLVPQPGHGRYGNIRTAAEYGYTSGDILAGAGHIRVKLEPDSAGITYILSVLPKDETLDWRNGTVAHAYVLDCDVADEKEDRSAP